MVELGYAMSSEEHRPNALVQHARRAEEVGFSFALISDHYHPWVDKQGQSPFVWSVIGGIAQATTRLRLGTGVTCPTVRIHPAIIAQAAATAGAMMEGRFFLGLGSGEALNEHILGDRWPAPATRLEMLEEAIEVIRLLWQGGVQSFEGAYYVVDRARVYTLPEQPVPIMVAAAGSNAAELAGRVGEGLIATEPSKETVQAFQGAGGNAKPRIGQYSVCVAKDEQTGRKIAYEWWPTAALTGQLTTELVMPAHFEGAAEMVTEDDVAKSVVCSLDPEQHSAKIREYEQAGFDHVYVHQIGPDQDTFFRFYEQEVLPKVR